MANWWLFFSTLLLAQDAKVLSSNGNVILVHAKPWIAPPRRLHRLRHCDVSLAGRQDMTDDASCSFPIVFNRLLQYRRNCYVANVGVLRMRGGAKSSDDQANIDVCGKNGEEPISITTHERTQSARRRRVKKKKILKALHDLIPCSGFNLRNFITSNTLRSHL